MRIPSEQDFIIGWKQDAEDPDAKPKPIFTDYIDAPELRQIGDRLIQSGPLTSLDDGKLIIDYRWKHKGGTSQGAPKYAKCQKLSGAARHYANGAQFMVWFAADHNAEMDDRQIEALVFHELQHIDRIETEDEDLEGNPIIEYKIRAHDVELFFADLQQYGAWNDHLQHLERVVKQLPLPIGGEDVSAEVAKAARTFVKDTFRPGGGIDSVTFGSPGHESVTITKEDAARL